MELTGKHFSCSEHISWQHIVIWLSLHFFWEKIDEPVTIIFPKMLPLKSKFINLTKIYLIPIFPHLSAVFNLKKSMLIPNLRYMLTHRLHINHQKCQFGRHPLLGRGCYAKRLLKIFRKSQIKIKFLISRFQKPVVSSHHTKNTLGLLVFEK